MEWVWAWKPATFTKPPGSVDRRAEAVLEWRQSAIRARSGMSGSPPHVWSGDDSCRREPRTDRWSRRSAPLDRYGVGLKAILLSGTWALVLSLFATRWAIRQFAAWGLGQLIREDGPRSHPVKRGTPTMGGAAVAASVVVAYAVAKLATWEAPTRSALLVLLLR